MKIPYIIKFSPHVKGIANTWTNLITRKRNHNVMDALWCHGFVLYLCDVKIYLFSLARMIYKFTYRHITLCMLCKYWF